MANLTDEQIEEYVNCEGNRCPFCKSDDLEGNAWEADRNWATQEVKCCNCSEEWQDLYILKGIVTD